MSATAERIRNKRHIVDSILDRLLSSRGDELNSWPRGFDKAMEAVWVDEKFDPRSVLASVKKVEQRVLPILKDKIERATPLRVNGAYRSSGDHRLGEHISIGIDSAGNQTVTFTSGMGFLRRLEKEGRIVTGGRHLTAVLDSSCSGLISLTTGKDYMDQGRAELKVGERIEINYGDTISVKLYKDENPFDDKVEVDQAFTFPVAKTETTVV